MEYKEEALSIREFFSHFTYWHCLTSHGMFHFTHSSLGRHSIAHREPPNGNISVAGSRRRETGGRRLYYCFHRKEQENYLVSGSFEQFQRALGHRDILVF